MDAHLRLEQSRRQFLAKMFAAGFAIPFGGTIIQACASGTSSVTITPTNALATRRIFLDSFYTLNNDYWQGWDRGSREACAKLNMEYQRVVDEFNVSVQQSAIENAPTLGVNGMFMISNTEGASPQLLRKLQAEGIYAVNNWSNAPWSTPLDIGDHYVAYHTADNVQSVRKLCNLMFQKLGGHGNFIHISGVPGNSSSEERDQGVNLALGDNPGITLLARQPGQYSRGGTAPVIENLLTAHPNVDAIFAQNDDSAIAVVNALEKRGIKALVAGTDAISEFVAMIEQGRAFGTWAHHGGWIGAWSTVRVFDALNGVKLTTPERMMYFQGFNIDTPEAARAYNELMYKKQPFPFDYEKMSRVLHPQDWDPQNLLTPIHPEQYWAWRAKDKPAGYTLPGAYAAAQSQGDFEKITRLYADHFKSDPLKEVKALTSAGK